MAVVDSTRSTVHRALRPPSAVRLCRLVAGRVAVMLRTLLRVVVDSPRAIRHHAGCAAARAEHLFQLSLALARQDVRYPIHARPVIAGGCSSGEHSRAVQLASDRVCLELPLPACEGVLRHRV